MNSRLKTSLLALSFVIFLAGVAVGNFSKDGNSDSKGSVKKDIIPGRYQLELVGNAGFSLFDTSSGRWWLLGEVEGEGVKWVKKQTPIAPD